MYIAGSSSSNRVTGMVSGLDVDSLVASAMEAEMYEYNKVYQDRQLTEWKTDAYQDVISDLSTFEDTYFNYLNSDSNMLSMSSYSVMTASSSSSAVDVKAGDDAFDEQHTLEVTQLPTAASYSSSSSVSRTVAATAAVDYSNLDGTLVFDVDGTEKEIDLSGVNSESDLQTAIDKAIGSGKIAVSTNADGYLEMAVVNGSGVTQVDISDTSDSILTALGFDSGSVLTNRLDTELTLAEINGSMTTPFSFDSNSEINLSINGVDFTFSEETTLEEMMLEINSSPDAAVTMSYKSSTGTFSIVADQTGLGDTIELSETGSTFLDSLGLSYTEGQDAVIILDGETLIRSDNTFSVDDVTYTLNDVTTEAVGIDVSVNTDSAYDMIETFVNAYNDLIDSLESIVSEEYDNDYPPLTESQKSEMSDDEIESWEQYAKAGVLEDDAYIEDLLSDMRSALYEPVAGVGISLSDIGITTGDYSEKGKLKIDEDILREALEKDSESVILLFAQESSTYPGTTTARDLDGGEMAVRYEEEGLMFRLYDAIENKVSTQRDANGNKGSLLELAGKEGDSSESDNTLYYEYENYTEELFNLEEWLIEKEEELYADYTVMETAITNMNAELEALYSMME